MRNKCPCYDENTECDDCRFDDNKCDSSAEIEAQIQKLRNRINRLTVQVANNQLQIRELERRIELLSIHSSAQFTIANRGAVTFLETVNTDPTKNIEKIINENNRIKIDQTSRYDIGYSIALNRSDESVELVRIRILVLIGTITDQYVSLSAQFSGPGPFYINRNALVDITGPAVLTFLLTNLPGGQVEIENNSILKIIKL